MRTVAELHKSTDERMAEEPGTTVREPMVFCAACTACELSLGPRQSFNVSQAYDGIIDGESLLAFANSPNALSRDSLLLEVVPLSQLARLVYAIQVSPAMKST